MEEYHIQIRFYGEVADEKKSVGTPRSTWEDKGQKDALFLLHI
jgi:hypothetical protein